jgi:dipeptide/tripeptide permease
MAGLEGSEKRPLADDLRDLLSSPRELWIAYAIWLVESIGIFTMLYTLVLWLSVDFGYGDQGAANWATAWSSCATLFMLVSGFVGDSMDLRRAMTINFGLLMVGRFLMGFAQGRGVAITGLMIMCVGYAGVAPVLNTAFRRYSHPRARAFAFSVFYVVNNIGSAGAGFIVDECRKPFLSTDGKTLAPRVVNLPFFGAHTLSAYRSVFLVGAALAVFGFLLTLLLRPNIDTERSPPSQAAPGGIEPPPEVKGSTGAAEKARPPWEIALEVVREPTFWRFMLLMGLLVFVKMIFQHGYFTLPKYAIRELGEGSPIGTFQAINPVAIIVLVPVATALTRHVRPFRVILVGSAISALSVFILVLPASYWTIAGFFVVLAVGESLWSPRSYELIATIAPKGRESSYMGLSGLPFFVGKFAALPMSGWLLSKYCPEIGPRHASTMWLIIGLTTILAPVLMFLLRPVIEGDSPTAPRLASH